MTTRKILVAFFVVLILMFIADIMDFLQKIRYNGYSKKF